MSTNTSNANGSQTTNQNPSLGKFKGVMLCNRPIAGPDEGTSTLRTELKAFKTGVVPEPLGMNPILQYRESKKRPPVPAVVKHKQWLSELQKARELILQEEEEEKKHKVDRSKNYYKNEAMLRKIATETREMNESKRSDYMETKSVDIQHESSDSKIDSKSEQIRSCTPPVESKVNNIETKESSYSTRIKVKDNKERPKWAYTENDYKKKEEENEEEEMDNLMDFVQNLDVENYLDDLEVRAALMKAKNRIAELAEPKSREEDKLQPGDLANDNFFRENYEHQENENDRYDESKLYKDVGTETDDEVESIYSESQAIREIHSKQSLKQKIKQMKDMPQDNEYTGPTIIENKEDGGARLNKSSYPANLPYLHRNPSV